MLVNHGSVAMAAEYVFLHNYHISKDYDDIYNEIIDAVLRVADPNSPDTCISHDGWVVSQEGEFTVSVTVSPSFSFPCYISVEEL